MNSHPKYPRRLVAALLVGGGLTAAVVIPGAAGYADEDRFTDRPHAPAGSARNAYHRSPVRLAGIREVDPDVAPKHAIRASGNAIGNYPAVGAMPTIPPPFEPLKLVPPDTNNRIQPASSTSPVLQQSFTPVFPAANSNPARPMFGNWSKEDSRLGSVPISSNQPPVPYAQFPVPGNMDSVKPPPSATRGVLSRGFSSWMNDRVRSVRELFTSSSQSSPQANFGSQMSGVPLSASASQGFTTGWNPYVPFPTPGTAPPVATQVPPKPISNNRPVFQGQTANGQLGYAGNPAYRWYGWGTTTPGANPYSPTGDYPVASASWYSMTGATPGAFPVPVVNAFRPPPGNEPPNYLVQAGGALPVSSVSPVASVPPAPRPIAQSQSARRIPIVPSALAANVPPREQTRPPVQTPVDTKWQPSTHPLSVPVDLSAPSVPATPAPADTNWQRAQSQPVVIRGQQPDPAPTTLIGRVREACQGMATNVAMTEIQPGSYRITFDSNSEALSELAAHAISSLAELKPVQIEFRARVPSR